MEKATLISDVTKKLPENFQKKDSMQEPSDIDKEIQKQIEANKRDEINRRFFSIYGRSYVPKRHCQFITSDSESKQWSEFYAATKLFNPGYILALVGGRGNGKTQLAVCIVRRMCVAMSQLQTENERELAAPIYASAMDIFLSIRDAIRTNLSEKKAIESYIRPPLLVIDECQERGETAFEDRTLSYIIDKRYAAVRETILIANQTQGEFEKSMGSSVVSRINETGGIKVFDWKSFRKKE